MSIRPGGCRTCNLEQHAEGKHVDDEALAIFHGEQSFRDIVKELIALRASHNCQAEEDLASLRASSAQQNLENKGLQLELSVSRNEVKRLTARAETADATNKELRKQLASKTAETIRLQTLIGRMEREYVLSEKVFEVRGAVVES